MYIKFRDHNINTYELFNTCYILCFCQLLCREDFIDYWVKGNMLTKEITSQVFTILKQPDHNYLVQVGFCSCTIYISPFFCHIGR